MESGSSSSGWITSKRTPPELRRKRQFLAVAHDRQLHLLSGLRLRQDGVQRLAAVDRLAVDGLDHVAGLQSGLGGGRAGTDQLHQTAVRRDRRRPSPGGPGSRCGCPCRSSADCSTRSAPRRPRVGERDQHPVGIVLVGRAERDPLFGHFRLGRGLDFRRRFRLLPAFRGAGFSAVAVSPAGLRLFVVARRRPAAAAACAETATRMNRL